MTMETYVPIDEARFRLHFRSGDLPPFGRFFFTRLLWRIYPTGGHWIAHSFFYFILILATLLLFILDVIVLLIYATGKILSWLLTGLGLLLWRLFQKLFESVVYPTLKNAFVLIVLIVLFIVLIYRFDNIRDFILKIFDQWLK